MAASLGAGWTLLETKCDLIDLSHPFRIKIAFTTSVLRMYTDGINTNDRMMSKKPRIMTTVILWGRRKLTNIRIPVRNSADQVMTLIWMFTKWVRLRFFFAKLLSKSLTLLFCSCLKIAKYVINKFFKLKFKLLHTWWYVLWLTTKLFLTLFIQLSM